MLVEIDDEGLRVFARNLCQRNLSDPRVQCCAACPIKTAIVQIRPGLAPLFEEKRAAVLALPGGNKWRRCLGG